MVDLYSTLGVPRTASPEQIKRAYRRLARSCHPDVNRSGEEQFKALAAAAEVLTEPRALRAVRRHSARPPRAAPLVHRRRARGAPFDFSAIFEDEDEL